MALTAAVTLVDNVQAVIKPDSTADFVSGDGGYTLTVADSKALSATTTPATTGATAYKLTLSSGSGSIDLTAVTSPSGTLDFTGKKVQVLKLRNLSSNANDIVIIPSVSNGYAIAGSDFKCTLAPGQWITLYGNAATPTIGSSAKGLTITGTGAQILEVFIAVG